MDRFQCSIEVDASPNVCYQKWHHFEQFPHFMENVEDVRRTGDKGWHWVVSGPLGHRTEWDSVIDADEPGQLISWRSVAGSEVTVSGLVNFVDLGQNQTRITCDIEYQPPGGALGEAVAHLFMNPEKLVQENLYKFKQLVEGTNVPAEKIHSGRYMQPNEFVVSGENPTAPNDRGNAAEIREIARATGTEIKGSPGQSTTSVSGINSTSEDVSVARVGRAEDYSGPFDEDEYELIYGLEDELPPVGTSANLDRKDIQEIELLNEEESPYLGLGEGSIYSEDLIDMRNDNPFNAAGTDIYAESMDVFDEDLDSFTESIDSDIDSGLGRKESIQSYEQNADAWVGPREMNQSMEAREIRPGLSGDQ